MSILKIYKNGNREWRNSKGRYHRVDGPAIEGSHGAKEWWLNGKYHRLDGPAIEWASGSRSWWVKGKQYTETEFKELIQI